MKAAQPDTSTPAVEVRDLVKRFGNFYALRGISLQVPTGECLAIFGPNGAGKTTFLRILSAISRPSSGEVSIHGLALQERSLAVRRRLGVIGHQTFLYDDLSAVENLMFYARLYDLGAPRECARAALAEVDLEKRADDRVRSFSRGMQQRLAIARALLHEPSILFLDEPYTGLDQHAAVMLTGWLQKLRNQRRTILVVTHDLAQGLAMADRLMIFVGGRVVWQERAAHVEARRLHEIYFDLVSGGR